MDTNRYQLAVVREATLGTTPNTPRMRKLRITGQSLTSEPQFDDSEEIRDDRMTPDPALVGESNTGGINIELHYPVPDSALSELLASTFQNDWVNTPARDNDGTADSVITGIAATGGVITVTTGDAFLARHLVQLSGFGVAQNNGLFVLTTGSATVPAVGNSLLADEAVPPGTARVKVVGLMGASGDITALADGLGSTSLDWTTFGLPVGAWVYIGDPSNAGFHFAAAPNGWARVAAAPTATKLPLDNLPVGWTTDDGSGKTVRVFFGDRVRNGVVKRGVTLESGFLGQAVPSYVVQKGRMVNTLQLSVQAKQKITASLDTLGMSSTIGTVALDASPDAAPAPGRYPILAASANVGRVGEAGARLTGPNYVRSLQVSIGNNLSPDDVVDDMATVNIGQGSISVEVTAETYFGDISLLQKVRAGTPTNLNMQVAKAGRGLVLAFPRLTPRSGWPTVPGKDQRVMLPIRMTASIDEATNAMVTLDRFEYLPI